MKKAKILLILQQDC